jgi:hypothetical protein
VRLVSSTLGEAFEESAVVVLLQLVLVRRVSAVFSSTRQFRSGRGRGKGNAPLLDDLRRPLPGTQSTKVCESLLSDNDVEVVLRLVDVSGEGNDARDAGCCSDDFVSIVASWDRVEAREYVRSVLLGLADGVCIMLNFAFLKKSALPPNPFNILLPSAFVEFAWA